MTSEPGLRLSSEELGARKFAAHRQLSRWAKHRPLRPRQQARRDALLSAVRALADDTLHNGCHLQPMRGDRDDRDWRKIERGLFESADERWRVVNPWRLKIELRHRWFVAQQRSDGVGGTCTMATHATLRDARAYVATRVGRRSCPTGRGWARLP